MSTTSKDPATPEMVPPATVSDIKCPPEEDLIALTIIAPSEAEVSNATSLKKAQAESEGETSKALLKRQQEIEDIKTDEDAVAFFHRMKELFAMSVFTDNEIHHHDVDSALDRILAGVAKEPANAVATVAALSPTALSPYMGLANDTFLEFVDFSLLTTLEDGDNDSKAPVLDLVTSSETNPSPEFGSEGESRDRSDPLYLGSLREIDGGESAYYHTDGWKWEGQMHTIDQPWAIFA